MKRDLERERGSQCANDDRVADRGLHGYSSWVAKSTWNGDGRLL